MKDIHSFLFHNANSDSYLAIKIGMIYGTMFDLSPGARVARYFAYIHNFITNDHLYLKGLQFMKIGHDIINSYYGYNSYLFYPAGYVYLTLLLKQCFTCTLIS